MVTVVSTIWLAGDDAGPPTLELRLSSGAYAKIGWDCEYAHRLLWWAPDGETDFVSCTAERTGLDPDVFGPLVDEVARAAECHESNLRAEYEADDNNYGDDR